MSRTLSDAVRGTALLGLPLALIAIVATAVATPSGMRVVVSFLITVSLVVALQTFSGNSGIVSFGHVAFMGVGAYTAALLSIPPILKKTQLPDLPGWLADADLGFLPSILAGAALATVLAVLVGLVLARMREGALAMATIGVLFIFFDLFDNADRFTRGASGIFGIPRDTDQWWALAFALVVIFVAIAFRSSSRGMQLRASSADALAAEALGSSVVRLRFTGWVLSAGLMGLAGGLWAHYNLAFDPREFFLPQTLTLLAIVTVGGLESVSGVVVGAIAITVVTEVVRRVEDQIGIPGLTQMAVALLILLVLFRRPTGIVGPVELHTQAGRRLAARGRGAA
jgi:branched-chain amino acid transport system permease protein